MENYENAWKQIVQPPKSSYHNDFDQESEVKIGFRTFTKHDVEYCMNDSKEFVKKKSDDYLLRRR